MADAKYGYVPPSVQKEMNAFMQRGPANLQKYAGGQNYVPERAAKNMTSYMQKNMPAHMKQYITPYMHEVKTAGLNSLDPGTTRTIQERPPVPNLMRRDHSAFGEQFNVNVDTSGKAKRGSFSYAPQYSDHGHSAATAPPAPPPAPLPNGNANPYDFIMNSGKPSKKGLTPQLNGGSKTQRLIIVAVGALFLLLLIVVVASFVLKGGSSSSTSLIDLAQQQTEIARVADIGVNQATSTATKNFAYTTKLSMVSGQQQTVALLAKNGHKLDEKLLGIKMNAVTDQQLNAATANNSFDETFTKLLADELTSYKSALQADYKASTSISEKQFLQNSFVGANILLGDQKT